MSDTQAQMGEAIQPKEATKIAGKPFEEKTPEAPKENGKTELDFSKMTGEQAKAYVESQKTKKNPVKEAIKEVVLKKAKTPETPKETPEVAAVKKYKVKIEGEELEVDEEELLRGYQHQRAANKILQDGKAARKQAEEFISMMKDPEKFWETAKKLGHDDRKLAEQFLASKLEEEMMDPRDRELKVVKAKLKQVEDLEKQQKEALEAQRHEALKKKFAADYTTQFTEALKNHGLPPDKDSVMEMAKYIHRSAKIGFKMTASEAAQLVLEDLDNKTKHRLKETPAETIVRILGEDVVNKIRGYDVGKLKSPEDHLRTPEQQGEVRDRKVPHKRMTPTEWREFNRRP